MGTSGQLFFALLILFNILGVSLGYSGIARLQAAHVPPFPMPDTGLYTFIYGFACPPYRVTLLWDSGRILVWLGCILVPLGAGILMLAKRRYISGWSTMLVWTVISGLYGFWLWFFSLFNGAA